MNRGILWLESSTFQSPVDLKYNKAKHYHVTLMYNVKLEHVEYLVGNSIQCVAVENCWNDDIQALRIKFADRNVLELCTNKVPHMTLSHRDGVSPVKSNDMFANLYNKESIYHVMNLNINFHQFN